MFGKNLKYYRLKRNMTKKDLAEAVGLTPMAITNYESDYRKPSFDIVVKIAKALNVDIKDFITVQSKELSFEHEEFRKTSKLTQTKQEFIREAVEEYFGRFFNAIDCLGRKVLPDPIESHKLTVTKDVEKDALELRKALDFPTSGPIINLITHLEYMGIFILFLNIDNESFSGMNGRVENYSYIVVNSNHSAERIRSTVAHELAHIMFKNIGKEKEQELYATAISGAFLLPRRDLIIKLGLKRNKITKDLEIICKEYGVSSQMLMKRAEVNGIISSSQLRDFFISITRLGWRKKEPSRINREEPLLFKELVFRGINEGEINIDKGAELLKITHDELNKYCGLWEDFQ